ncbi:MAG: GPP34 family phosphoprotein [Bacteroidales bacterium]|nr:GPP34 family phosphoprotein [Bacteroidales bacterium]
MAEKNFNIAEKFLLIAHHPEKGRFMISQLYIQYGIAGAIVLDMMLEDRIDIADKKLILKTARGSADPIISEVIALMSQSSRSRRVEYWVRKLATRYNKYKWLVLKGLADKRIVRIEEKKFLGLIPYRKSSLIESYTRSNIIRQLKSEVLAYTREPSSASMSIAGLIEACRMHRILSDDREERKTIRTQLKKMIKESPVSDAVSQTIKQVQAAIIASVTAAIVASTAGRRH